MDPRADARLPPIPAKRYFTIGEVSELCGVKPYVLRYWEQEFTQLKPMKRRGNRRYYQHHEVLLIRRIRDLLYDQGFTISGARNRLSEAGALEAAGAADAGSEVPDAPPPVPPKLAGPATITVAVSAALQQANGAELRLPVEPPLDGVASLRNELMAIRELLVF
ncbi:MerR family transcriptional regulator [Ideonella sp.]|uniref:MerR family transcriptional regulator n=1 Tax=Ideonella sp. TaxID=1929293 RepID=UPI0035B196BF